ncbi:hypothetical protein BJ970_000558 [Saccharopolyspora phatthalungensis]|uniref:Uncharacterized protein n=1 Tax=Saccharopolyspora phatthalungensis TaxID=664693 RepID=A0A840PYH8_9PSEU|nr:hypothetical protein [Saccharopolyspora phatthalungensis]
MVTGANGSECRDLHCITERLKAISESIEDFARSTRSRAGERNWRVPFALSAVEQARDELLTTASEWEG